VRGRTPITLESVRTYLRTLRVFANWGKAKQQVGRVYLHLQRQREDFARKTASALISSHDLIALEDLQVRNLVRNRRLAKSISDVSWSRLRWWVEYYGRLHGVPVIAVPPEYTSQDCTGVLPDGSPCPARVTQVAQHADACLSALWAHLGPRRERRCEYSGVCPGAGPGGGTLAG
jgi:IS605 OrfB family transposase